MRGFSFTQFRLQGARAAAMFACALLVLLALPSAAQDAAVKVSPSLTDPGIGNEFIERNFMSRTRWTGTWALDNKISGESLPPTPEEFAFTLMDGTAVSSNDFEYIGRVDEHLDHGGRRLILSFRHHKMGVDVQALYTLYPDDFFMRKSLRMRCDKGRSVSIDSVTVEHFTGVTQAYGGGLGQPVFMDQHIFTGLEHPAGHSVIRDMDIILMHYPGWTLGQDWVESFSAVTGAAPKGIDETRQAFTLYLHTIRRPPNPITVYNSWYDIRSGGMNTDAFVSIFDTINQNLGRHGARLDSVVVDDGWQNPDSLWDADKRLFPEDLAPLGRALHDRGGRLGLWLPLCGHTLKLPFSKTSPYEVSPEGHYFCMSGPKYNAALRTRLRDLIQNHGALYFKHDFNYFNCTGEGDGYKPTPAQSFEANASAMAGLLDFMRRENPAVFSSVTSHMWLSPWWLAHADTVWIGSADYGYNLTAPAIEPRDRSITYYDAHIYDLLTRREQTFPPYAMMTHGIIDGRLNRLGGENEPLLTWADNVMMYLGRGVQMRELYITPSLLDDAKWKILAKGLNWAKLRDPVFSFYGRMFGGDPARGEVYGFSFFNQDTQVLTLRNPGYSPRQIDLQLAHPDNLLHIVYPYDMWHDQLVVDRQGRFKFPLGEHQVVIMESVPRDAIKRPVLRGVRTKIIREGPEETEYEIRTVQGSLRFFIASPAPVHSVRQDGKLLEPDNTGAYHGDTPGGTHFFLDPPLSAWSETKIRNQAADMELRLMFRKDVRAPEFVMTLSGRADEIMPAQLEYDGRTVAASATGRGWAAFSLPVEYGTHTHRLRIRTEDVMATPFATSGFAITSYAGCWYPGLTTRITVKHGSAPPSDAVLPVPITQDEFRLMDLNVRGRAFNLEQEMPARAFDSIGPVRAAKVRISVFGNRGNAPARILINGAPAAPVPSNGFPFMQWETFVVDIPETQLGAIRKNNKVSVMTTDGAPFKFKNIAISVQGADGLWLNSGMNPEVFTTDPDWEHAEGRSFSGRSPAIMLQFP